MKFEFAKFTDITELAFKYNTTYKDSGYVKFFICNDVLDIWLIRVLEGYNEEYEEEEGSFIVERDNIAKESKGDGLSLSKVIKIIKEDEGGNWDLKQVFSLDEAIELVDGGFGIN